MFLKISKQEEKVKKNPLIISISFTFINVLFYWTKITFFKSFLLQLHFSISLFIVLDNEVVIVVGWHFWWLFDDLNFVKTMCWSYGGCGWILIQYWVVGFLFLMDVKCGYCLVFLLVCSTIRRFESSQNSGCWSCSGCGWMPIEDWRFEGHNDGVVVVVCFFHFERRWPGLINVSKCNFTKNW